MDKYEVLRILEQIEDEYKEEVESKQDIQKLGGKDNDSYQGEYEVVDVLRSIENDPDLINDFEIGTKMIELVPHLFSALGEDITKNKEFCINALKLNPETYHYMNYSMQTKPEILTEFVKISGYIPQEVDGNISTDLLEQLKPYVKYKIEGLREDTYIGRIYGEEYETNEYGEMGYIMGELPKHVICCTRGNEKFEISLYTTYSLSSSGYSTDSRGNIEIKKVQDFGEITKPVRGDQTFILAMQEKGFECPAFSVDYVGGDEYYPSGDVSVNEELFIDKEELVENSVKGEQDLDSLSEDELEDMLKSKQDQNQAKKEELDNLRKQELIEQIKAAQQEGKELDAQIAEAKKNNRLID